MSEEEQISYVNVICGLFYLPYGGFASYHHYLGGEWIWVALNIVLIVVWSLILLDEIQK